MLAPYHETAAIRLVQLQLLRLLLDDSSRFHDTVATVLAEHDVSWDGLIASACYHGVLSVIDWRDVTSSIPGDARETAERRLTIQHIWHEHLMNGLRMAVAALRDAHVPACALKGPALAERFYPRPQSRHCLDLDILVRPEEFDRAAAVLARVGYRTGDSLTRDYQREFSHHLEYAGPGLPPLELHFRTYAGFGAELPAGALFDRATPFVLGSGVSVLVPAPEDEFVYLSVHAAGHSFIRLVWVYDLALLVRKHPSLDWNRVAATAAQFGVIAPVAYAIRLLQLWLGVTIEGLPLALQHRNARSRMADWLLDEVSTPQPKSIRDNLGGLLFTSLLCDRVTSGGWLLQHHMLRSARRRLKKAAPAYLPETWSA